MATAQKSYIGKNEAWKCGMCAMCCTGMELVELTPDQWAYYQKKYPFLELTDKTPAKTPGEFNYEFKCNALDGKICTVYAKRPRFCRQYPFNDVKRSELHDGCGFKHNGKWDC